MHLKKTSQQHTRGIRKVRPHAVLDLRQIRLADGPLRLRFDGADNLLLGHVTTQPPKGALDQPQVAKFFTKQHIAICYIYIAICDSCQIRPEGPARAHYQSIKQILNNLTTRPESPP